MKKTLIHSLTFPPDTISTGMIVSKIAKEINNTQSNIEILASSPQYNLKNSAEFSKINSKILSVSQKLNFQLVIILENGQIWQSVEKIRDIRLRDGFEVEITEGFLSGYTLRVPGKKIKIRVRRQK